MIGIDGNRAVLWDGVSDSDELNFHSADFDFVARSGDFVFELFARQSLVHLVSYERMSELGAVDWSVNVSQKVREAADVVFVGVSKKNSSNFVLVLDQICEVGHDDVDAIHFFIRERKSAVDDDNVISLLDNTTIFPNLSNSTKRDNANNTHGYQGTSLQGEGKDEGNARSY